MEKIFEKLDIRTDGKCGLSTDELNALEHYLIEKHGLPIEMSTNGRPTGRKQKKSKDMSLYFNYKGNIILCYDKVSTSPSFQRKWK